MNALKALENRVHGWLPNEPRFTKAHGLPKSRLKKPQWIALTAITVVVLAFVVYSGVQTFLRWSDPRLDVTASYFEKSVNATTVHAGDVVGVTVRVGWHGRVFPEFARDVMVVDVLPKESVLVDGSNVFEYRGSGGSDQFRYTIKVNGQTGMLELSEPKLYLDGTEIGLNGSSPKLQVLS